MGEHLSPSGGRDLEKIFGGESKEPKSHLLQGGNPKNWQNLGGESKEIAIFFKF